MLFLRTLFEVYSFSYVGIGSFVLACETAKKPICFIDLLWFEFWDGHEPLNKTALLTTPDTFAMDLRHSALFLYFQGYCVSTDIQERVVWGKFTEKKRNKNGSMSTLLQEVGCHILQYKCNGNFLSQRNVI